MDMHTAPGAQTKMLSEDDLGPADKAIVDMLEEGRVTAPFVAEETGYSLQYIRDRLGRLVEHGNATKVYDGLYELTANPRSQGGSSPQPTDDVTVEVEEPAVTQQLSDELEAAIDAALEGWPPENERKRESRREAARAALEYLAQREKARQSDFVDDVEPEAGVPGQKPATWWESTVLAALNHARERGYTESDNNNWYWQGENDA